MTEEELNKEIKAVEAADINAYKANLQKQKDCPNHDFRNKGETLGGGTEFRCIHCKKIVTTSETIKRKK